MNRRLFFRPTLSASIAAALPAQAIILTGLMLVSLPVNADHEIGEHFPEDWATDFDYEIGPLAEYISTHQRRADDSNSIYRLHVHTGEPVSREAQRLRQYFYETGH